MNCAPGILVQWDMFYVSFLIHDKYSVHLIIIMTVFVIASDLGCVLCVHIMQ